MILAVFALGIVIGALSAYLALDLMWTQTTRHEAGQDFEARVVFPDGSGDAEVTISGEFHGPIPKVGEVIDLPVAARVRQVYIGCQ